ncbi:hypothetical protein [Streptomyces gardneri]|uniref:hypothetical protein n=1 Tax=Streptomyces gardneri TaxID=66892 RepID=UPI00367EFD98
MNAIVSRNGQQAHMFVWTCAGGESICQLSGTLRLLDSEVVTANPLLQLYEGSSCSSGDLENQRRPGAKYAHSNVSLGWSLGVRNSEFGSYYDDACSAFDVTDWEGSRP